MASNLLYVPVRTSSSYHEYVAADGTRYEPVLTGHYTDPASNREVYVDRPRPTCGSGPYYKYVGPSDLSRARSEVGGTSYKKYYSASIDAASDTSSTPNRVWYTHVFSDGVFGYIAHCDGSKNKPYGYVMIRSIDRVDGRYAYVRQWSSPVYWFTSLGHFQRWVANQLSNPLGSASRVTGVYASFSDASPRPPRASYPGHDAYLLHNETGNFPINYELVAAQAYLSQAQSVPEATTNSIANILEIAASLNDLLKGRVDPKTLMDPASAWLSYRYSYSTTKSDIEEYVSLTKRLLAIAKSDRVRSYGMASSGGVVCRCTAVYDPATLLPDSVVDFLQQYGIKASLVNAWDLVPYSFIADWFLPIGDFLQELEDRGNMLELKPTEVWYSFSQNGEDGEWWYMRVPDGPKYNAPFLTSHHASAKTWIKRIADGVSLWR